MLEQLLVALIVVVAFSYAAWTFIPPGMRAALAQRLGAWGAAPGRAPWSARIAAWLSDLIQARGGGCADCNAAKSRTTADARKGHPRV